MPEDEAWVTLATNDSYALGALVVSRSLKRVNTSRKLVVMVTSGVSVPMRNALSSEFNVVYDVNIIDSQDGENLALLTRPELGITFTKLHCWKLVQFSKCVFLDADTLILQNCDELFDRSEFSASPDVGWPDCFNSGVFVFKPSIETFDKLLAFAIARGSFDGGDQGLLNLYFNDWSVSDISRHLPFIYNMVASATYTYLPAFKMFGANVKIVHFIGPEKPWLMYFDSSTGTVRAPAGQEHLFELLQSWWNIFRTDVHNKLSADMAGLAGAFAKMSLEGTKSDKQIEFEEQMRKHAWESGHIDYLGKDSFDKIMKKIHASMAQADKSGEPSGEKPTESVPTSDQPVLTPTAEPEQSVDESVLAEERLAVEKKLAEQKKVAEQKLIEEKQAAEARAAAASQVAPAPEQPATEQKLVEEKPAAEAQVSSPAVAEQKLAEEQQAPEAQAVIVAPTSEPAPAEQKLAEEKPAAEAQVSSEPAPAVVEEKKAPEAQPVAASQVASSSEQVVAEAAPSAEISEPPPTAPPRRQSKGK